MKRTVSMVRLVVALGFFAVLLGRAAVADPLSDAKRVEAQWVAAFTPLDPDAMAALYSEDAVFFGASPPLRTGRDGVRAYFVGLPKGVFTGVTFSDEQAVQLTPDVISVAGTATFMRGANPDLPFRITLVLVRRDGRWLIASHHVSPKTS